MFKTVKNVAKHSIIYGLGDLLAKCVGFLLIPLYTHYFSTEQYGVLELLELSSHVISFLLAMGITQSLVRFYFEFKSEQAREQVISVALISTWTISAVGFVLLFFSARSVSNLVFETPEYYRYFYIVFASLVLSLSNEIPLQLLRIQQKSVLYTTIALVRLTVQLTLNIVFIVVFEYGIAGILVSTLITNTLSGIFLAWYILKRITLSFSVSLLTQMLVYGFPLIGSWAGSFILHFCDRFLLQRLGSLSNVGIYSLSYKFGFLLNLFLLGPFKKTWAPKQFEVAEEENAPQTFALIFTYYWFVQVFLTLGICALIDDVIQIIADEKFHPAASFVPLILLAYNFNGAASFLEFGILYKKEDQVFSNNYPYCWCNKYLL